MVAVLAELPYQILRALLRQVLEQLRLPGRSSDGGFEVDIVSFPSSDAFENYLGDPHTQRHLRLLPRHLAGKEESKIRPHSLLTAMLVGLRREPVQRPYASNSGAQAPLGRLAAWGTKERGLRPCER
jgi:hypothetical protein